MQGLKAQLPQSNIQLISDKDVTSHHYIATTSLATEITFSPVK